MSKDEGRFEVTGFDELAAVSTAITSLLVCGTLAVLARHVVHPGWPALLALGCTALAAGARYRLAISGDGIEVVFLRAWCVPVERRRFLLDARIELYQSWEADEPEGLCVEPPWGWGEERTECFGPHWRQRLLADVHAAASAALAQQRQRVADAPTSTWSKTRSELDDAIDASTATYWSSGHVKSARLARALRVGKIALPAGTKVELNDDEWLDPRRRDRLARAWPSAPVALPLIGAPLTQPGAEIFFGDQGRARSARGAFAGPLTMGNVVIDGRDRIAWNEEGALDAFVLAAPLVVSGIALPSGSRFSSARLGTRRRWFVRPASAVKLPQLEISPLEMLTVSDDFARIEAASKRSDCVVDGVGLKGGIIPFPLDAHLSVDLETCKKAGLGKPPSRAR